VAELVLEIVLGSVTAPYRLGVLLSSRRQRKIWLALHTGWERWMWLTLYVLGTCIVLPIAAIIVYALMV
jgi:hypothetical protein